jgi:sortase A
VAAGPGGGQDRGPRQQMLVLQGISVSLVLLAAGVLGFLGYLFGVSRVAEARAQSDLHATLAGELRNEIGPLGPTAPGAPVALLSIPSIGVRDLVVVEGTTPENLTLGPGHLRDTPLPGQLGTSVIYGRRATYGAPFAPLGRLLPGGKINVITQQGSASYTVEAIGDSQHPVKDTALNRLVLLTASSSDVPAYYLEVDADLSTQPENGPVSLPAIGPAEAALADDPSALVLTMVWGLAVLGVSIGGACAASRWSVWPAYLAAAPAAVAVIWNLYENLASLLPNLY